MSDEHPPPVHIWRDVLCPQMGARRDLQVFLTVVHHELLDKVDMREKHAAAAVSLESQHLESLHLGAFFVPLVLEDL